MQNVKASTVAQRLLNLYRQEHVIFGGWAAVNQVFVAEATPDVIVALRELPTGGSLARHIENLRGGKTPMDSIERDLLPYGGAMESSVATTPVDNDQLQDLDRLISEFTPNEDGLARLMRAPVIQKFGPEWIVGVRNALRGKPEMSDKWNTIVQTYNAYTSWQRANQILNTPISDRVRAQLQADMPEYETYLPMFGVAGDELLSKLRTFISSIKIQSQSDEDATPASVSSSSDVR